MSLEAAAAGFLAAYLYVGCVVALARLYKHRSVALVRPLWWSLATFITIWSWPYYLMRRP